MKAIGGSGRSGFYPNVSAPTHPSCVLGGVATGQQQSLLSNCQILDQQQQRQTSLKSFVNPHVPPATCNNNTNNVCIETVTNNHSSSSPKLLSNNLSEVSAVTGAIYGNFITADQLTNGKLLPASAISKLAAAAASSSPPGKPKSTLLLPPPHDEPADLEQVVNNQSPPLGSHDPQLVPAGYPIGGGGGGYANLVDTSTCCQAVVGPFHHHPMDTTTTIGGDTHNSLPNPVAMDVCGPSPLPGRGLVAAGTGMSCCHHIAPDPQQQQPSAQRALLKMSVNLIATYKSINEAYYHKKRRLRGEQAVASDEKRNRKSPNAQVLNSSSSNAATATTLPQTAAPISCSTRQLTGQQLMSPDQVHSTTTTGPHHRTVLHHHHHHHRHRQQQQQPQILPNLGIQPTVANGMGRLPASGRPLQTLSNNVNTSAASSCLCSNGQVLPQCSTNNIDFTDPTTHATTLPPGGLTSLNNNAPLASSLAACPPVAACCNTTSSSTSSLTSQQSKATDPASSVVRPGDVWNNRYRVIGSIGRGTFGEVVRCLDQSTNQEVAVKIIKSKKSMLQQAEVEIKILKEIGAFQTNDRAAAEIGANYIVSLRDHFTFNGRLCLVFELLSYTLYDLLGNTNFRGVSLNLTRKFAQQLCASLLFLASRDRPLIHCDLKPENILLVNPKRSAIKVIDFGSSCHINQRLYQYIQSRFYRSPEVLFNLEYGLGIDMWSLGCILVEMHTGEALFSGQNELEMLLRIMEVMGYPPVRMLEASPKLSIFFDRIPAAQLQPGEEGLPQASSAPPQPSPTNAAPASSAFFYRPRRLFLKQGKWNQCNFRGANSRPLRDLIGVNIGGPHGRRLGEPDHGVEDYEKFIDLVQKMLVYDPFHRIRPDQALMHRFFARSREQQQSANPPPNNQVPIAVATQQASQLTLTTTPATTCEPPLQPQPQQQAPPSYLTFAPNQGKQSPTGGGGGAAMTTQQQQSNKTGQSAAAAVVVSTS